MQVSSQLKETKYFFQGKSMDEKHRSEKDAELYKYAYYLKNSVFQNEKCRIFIIHDSGPNNFVRLRFQFHLLPHNTENSYKLPAISHLRKGDCLVMLGDIDSLSFDRQHGVLSWDIGGRLSAWSACMATCALGPPTSRTFC